MDMYDKKNISPMLLSETDKPFDDNDYFYEIKFDGIRAIIYVSPKEIIIKSRNGKILNNLYPELLNLKKHVKKKCIFDGEIVLMSEGVPSFSKLQERNRLRNKRKIEYLSNNNPVTFVCFDILYENKSLMNLNLIKRKEILFKYNDNEYFVKSRYIHKNGTKLFDLVKEKGLEGIVAKLKTSKYIPNIRSKEWLKIKNIMSDDFYICGYKIKNNVVSLLLGDKINNKLKFISKVVIGKKRNEFNLIKNCNKTNNNFIDFDELDYIYIKPKYKAIVIFVEKTKNGHLRHPVFKGIRID